VTLWILWSIAVSALLYWAGMAIERAATYLGIARRAVWFVAIASAVLFPVVSIRRARSVPNVSGPATSGLAAITRDVMPNLVGASEAIATGPRLTALNDQASPWLVAIWLCASAILATLHLGALVDLRHRRSAWREVLSDDGSMLVSPDVGPAVVGVIRPRIVVPEWAMSIEPADRELLLRHEREHIRAHDMPLLLVAELVRIAFPWNVAIWRMVRRLRRAIEIDCDARVVRASGQVRDYALMLLSVSDRHTSPSRVSLATSLSEPKSDLEMRIDAMTTPRPRRPLVAALPFIASALAILVFAAGSPPPSAAWYQATSPRPLPGNLAPRYPDALRAMGVEGHVILGFTTSPGGVPDTSSFRELEASHTAFADAVRRAVRSWRFDSGGTVRMLFRFMTTATEQRERAGQVTPRYSTEVGAGDVVIIVTVPPT
jgi:beta-lactamase regulating signal transducer with metallopeptidase domain